MLLRLLNKDEAGTVDVPNITFYTSCSRQNMTTASTTAFLHENENDEDNKDQTKKIS